MEIPHGANQHPNAPTILPGLVVVDGPIGAGKTTFLQHLKEELVQSGARVLLIDEAIPENLEEYYKDPAKGVFEFQKKFALSLFEKWVNLYKSGNHPLREYDFILSDRYWASTRGFVQFHYDKGNITAEQYRELTDINNLFISICPIFPEFYFFLDEPGSACLERIKTRGRPGEKEAGDAHMSEINEYIRRYNCLPFFGQGEPSGLIKHLDEKDTRFICPRALLARAAQSVKCLILTGVEENTTKGKMLPEGAPVHISKDLIGLNALPLNTRTYLMEEALLIATAKKPTRELTDLSK